MSNAFIEHNRIFNTVSKDGATNQPYVYYRKKRSYLIDLNRY